MTTKAGVALFSLFMLNAPAFADQDKDIPIMETSNMVFVGFPHQGKVVDMSAYDERDEQAAEAYYRDLFLGEEIAKVEETCREEQERLERGEHDADTISCRLVDPGTFRIAYRFALQTPDTETPMAALVWDVRLTLGADRVTDIDAKASILAP